jgi:hypothetical protein
MKNHIRWFLVLIPLFALAFTVLAQTVSNAPPELNATDQKIHDLVARFSAWKFLFVPVIGALVMAIKKWLKFVPDAALPWCGPVIGALLDYIGGKAGYWTGSGDVGAVMGGLATWGHQALVKQNPLLDQDVISGSGKVGLWFLVGALSLGTASMTLTGCSTAGLGKLARELKNDPAIVAVKAVTPWGNASLVRVGGQTNSVSVSPDGTVTINPRTP